MPKNRFLKKSEKDLVQLVKDAECLKWDHLKDVKRQAVVMALGDEESQRRINNALNPYTHLAQFTRTLVVEMAVVQHPDAIAKNPVKSRIQDVMCQATGLVHPVYYVIVPTPPKPIGDRPCRFKLRDLNDEVFQIIQCRVLKDRMIPTPNPPFVSLHEAVDNTKKTDEEFYGSIKPFSFPWTPHYDDVDVTCAVNKVTTNEMEMFDQEVMFTPE